MMCKFRSLIVTLPFWYCIIRNGVICWESRRQNSCHVSSQVCLGKDEFLPIQHPVQLPTEPIHVGESSTTVSPYLFIFFFFFSWFLCSEARSFPTPGSQFTLHLEGSPISVLSRDAHQPIPPCCHLYPRLSFQDCCDEAPGQGRSVGLWLKQSMLATFDVPSVFSKMQ